MVHAAGGHVEAWVDVLEAGQVPAYDDQVQVALVLLVVRRDGVPVRADDREVDSLPPLAGLCLGQAERVTVADDSRPPTSCSDLPAMPSVPSDIPPWSASTGSAATGPTHRPIPSATANTAAHPATNPRTRGTAFMSAL